MNKLEEIEGIEHEVISLRRTLERLEARVKNLKKEYISELPMIYYTGTHKPREIVRYWILDEDVYFETKGNKFRCKRLSELPSMRVDFIKIPTIDYVFQVLDDLKGGYVDIDWIDHIELIKGVDDYDKT